MSVDLPDEHAIDAGAFLEKGRPLLLPVGHHEVVENLVGHLPSVAGLPTEDVGLANTRGVVRAGFSYVGAHRRGIVGWLG